MKNETYFLMIWVVMWLVTLTAIITVSRMNRTVFPAPTIQGMSVYKSDGNMIYEIRTYHGYHKLTKEEYEKYKVGDKYGTDNRN